MNRLAMEAAAGGLILLLGGLLLDARSDAAALQAQLTGCNRARANLEQQIKITAQQEGRRYERTEAATLAECRSAYDAGAPGGMSDAERVGAGRYLPGGSTGQPPG